MFFEFHANRQPAWAPAVDVCERAFELVIFVEMPGISRGDVKLSFFDGVLTIAGCKRPRPDEGVAQFHCLESNYGQFHREIAVNVPIDYDKARAELRDGLMRIYLPKRTSKPGPNEIPIT